MKFGVRLAVQGEMGAKGQGWDYTRDMAVEAEALGFDSVWLPDHVMNAHMTKTTPMLECWTVLSALAALTSKVTFAGHTFNNSLRNPAVMAKMAATFDVMFGGRLLYSLGSAWFSYETEGYGLPWDEHDDRVARLREALIIAKRMWTEPEVSFDGKFYTLDRAILEPKPVQKPHPPIIMGAASPWGRERVARYCDGWVPLPAQMKNIAAELKDLEERLVRHGRRLSYIEISFFWAPTNVDQLKRYRDLGVHRVILACPADSKDATLALLDSHAELMAAVGD